MNKGMAIGGSAAGMMIKHMGGHYRHHVDEAVPADVFQEDQTPVCLTFKTEEYYYIKNFLNYGDERCTSAWVLYDLLEHDKSSPRAMIEILAFYQKHNSVRNKDNFEVLTEIISRAEPQFRAGRVDNEIRECFNEILNYCFTVLSENDALKGK